MKTDIRILMVTFVIFLSHYFFIPAISCSQGAVPDQTLKTNFLNPPIDCWPQTYWWWPGNAVTKENITWQMEQMFEKGLGGVLITSAAPKVYEKGNIPYLSEKYLEMVKHAVETAKRLNMKVYLNFSTGWVFGGEWVPPEDRSQSLVPASIDIIGPTIYKSEIPQFVKAADHRHEIRKEDIPENGKLVAVVAGKIVNDKIIQAELIDLTASVSNNRIVWDVPKGQWRLMAFWLRYTGQKSLEDHWCVDHFSQTAMTRYCEFLGNKFLEAFGSEFGKTVEAFHCDSFELANLPNGIYWSDSLLAEFRRLKGYDLTKFLPAIWWDIENISPKIRYDVSDLLDHVGFKIFFDTFLNWCTDHGLKGSMEPIGFPTDVVQSAGKTPLPMLELTPGEKGTVPWFDTRIGPKKYISSGAHLYGRNVVAVEAYTYIHWELYRATLEELKIASDGFFCTGANKFINHGYSYSPEKDVAPSRSIPFAARISHPNIWWQYYPHLADYVARCSYMLRQGSFAPDIAIYSPLANQWTKDVLNARKWTREFDWGDLGRIIKANGYDYDLLNDDILQNQAVFKDGKILVRNMEYKLLILPNIESIPLETLQFIQQYINNGGVAIALERLPAYSVGFTNYATKDSIVKNIIHDMFTETASPNNNNKSYGNGQTFYLREILWRQFLFDPPSPVDFLNPLVETLNNVLAPDVFFDYRHENLWKNDGINFIHRKLADKDIYFVCNIRDKVCNSPITFRINNKRPWKWDPLNGEISKIHVYKKNKNGIEIPVNLPPYGSAFYVFENEPDSSYVNRTNFQKIQYVSKNSIEALATGNGQYYTSVVSNEKETNTLLKLDNIPSPYVISGNWQLLLENQEMKLDTTFSHLFSWTKNKSSKHFSGIGQYQITFDLPEKYISKNIILSLNLGRVCNVAEVQLNGVNVGTTWKSGQTLEITKVARVGTNKLIVLVTNTLINRVAGFTSPPPVPEDLIPHYGNGTTDYSSSFHGPIGFKSLPASGLLGPVKIDVYQKVKFAIHK